MGIPDMGIYPRLGLEARPLFIRAALPRLRLGGLQQRHDIRNLPKPIRHASGHRRGYAQRLMDANEIVVGHEQRDRVRVVLDLFREAVRQPGEAAHVHPHRQVRALGVARADMTGVGVALDGHLASADAVGGAVSALGAFDPLPNSA